MASRKVSFSYTGTTSIRYSDNNPEWDEHILARQGEEDKRSGRFGNCPKRTTGKGIVGTFLSGTRAVCAKGELVKKIRLLSEGIVKGNRQLTERV